MSKASPTHLTEDGGGYDLAPSPTVGVCRDCQQRQKVALWDMRPSEWLRARIGLQCRFCGRWSVYPTPEYVRSLDSFRRKALERAEQQIAKGAPT